MDYLQQLTFEMDWIILILLFLIAFLYSTVGHGGASGYLSVMAILGVATVVMKPAALLLNICVSGISFIYFFRAGFFRWKLFLPFAASSVPAAFAGGYMTIEPEIYRKALGASLVVPALRNFFVVKAEDEFVERPAKLGFALLSGAAIGFLSGMIGIGGGIFLSPLILLLNWAKMKETACIAALFIFVNSLSGLLGLFSAGNFLPLEIIPWVIAAISGGLLGAYAGSHKFNSKILGYLLSLILMFASIKLLFF